jgi:hypothetical protein
VLRADPADVAFDLGQGVEDALQEPPVLLGAEVLFETLFEAVDAHGNGAQRLGKPALEVEIPERPLELVEMEVDEAVLFESPLAQFFEHLRTGHPPPPARAFSTPAARFKFAAKRPFVK